MRDKATEILASALVLVGMGLAFVGGISVPLTGTWLIGGGATLEAFVSSMGLFGVGLVLMHLGERWA